MNPIVQNLLATIAAFAASLSWLRLNDYLAHKGWLESRTSRKIIHIGTGPIYILCWLFFTHDPYVRFLAALVPLLITIQFALVGFGMIKDDAAVQAMSRTGDPREILRGPLYYGVVFVVLTIIFWLDTPVGIIALALLCGGDGLAEIFGRKWGRTKLFWNQGKSWLGSAGFFFGGLISILLILAVYQAAGVFPGFIRARLLAIVVITFAATLIESISPHDWDNLTVPAISVLLGLLLF